MPIWLNRVQDCWSILVLVRALTWISGYWPGGGKWTAVALGIIAAVGAAGGRAAAARFSAAIRYFLIIMVGGVLISGIKEIKMVNLIPDWQLNSGDVITVFLLPAMCAYKDDKMRSEKRLLLIAFAASLITVGVLSPQYVGEAKTPFYELSRNLTLLGITKRYESIVATVMTLGICTFMIYVMTQTTQEDSLSKHCICSSGIAILLYAFDACIDSRFVAAGTALIWVILPVSTGLWIKLKKYEKNA